MKTSDALIRTIRWRQAVADGEMLESRDYTKTYLGFNRISQKELDILCQTVNFFYTQLGSNLRVSNSMGEIVPRLFSSTL